MSITLSFSDGKLQTFDKDSQEFLQHFGIIKDMMEDCDNSNNIPLEINFNDFMIIMTCSFNKMTSSQHFQLIINRMLYLKATDEHIEICINYGVSKSFEYDGPLEFYGYFFDRFFQITHIEDVQLMIDLFSIEKRRKIIELILQGNCKIPRNCETCETSLYKYRTKDHFVLFANHNELFHYLVDYCCLKDADIAELLTPDYDDPFVFSDLHDIIKRLEIFSTDHTLEDEACYLAELVNLEFDENKEENEKVILSIVKKMIGDINDQDEKGNTLLHYVCKRKYISNNLYNFLTKHFNPDQTIMNYEDKLAGER